MQCHFFLKGIKLLIIVYIKAFSINLKARLLSGIISSAQIFINI